MYGYWFNFNRGYIAPVGTTKLNRRYVGMPAKAIYSSILLGWGYTSMPLPDINKITLGGKYEAKDYLGAHITLGGKYEAKDYLGAHITLGGKYDPYSHTDAARITLGRGYTCTDPLFERS